MTPPSKTSKTQIRTVTTRSMIPPGGPIEPDLQICSECYKMVASPLALEEHLYQIHHGPYWCTSCSITFRLKSVLMKHIRLFHLQQGDFQCEVCPLSCTTWKGMLKHQNTHRLVQKMRREREKVKMEIIEEEEEVMVKHEFTDFSLPFSLKRSFESNPDEEVEVISSKRIKRSQSRSSSSSKSSSSTTTTTAFPTFICTACTAIYWIEEDFEMHLANCTGDLPHFMLRYKGPRAKVRARERGQNGGTVVYRGPPQGGGGGQRLNEVVLPAEVEEGQVTNNSVLPATVPFKEEKEVIFTRFQPPNAGAEVKNFGSWSSTDQTEAAFSSYDADADTGQLEELASAFGNHKDPLNLSFSFDDLTMADDQFDVQQEDQNLYQEQDQQSDDYIPSQVCYSPSLLRSSFEAPPMSPATLREVLDDLADPATSPIDFDRSPPSSSSPSPTLFYPNQPRVTPPPTPPPSPPHHQQQQSSSSPPRGLDNFDYLLLRQIEESFADIQSFQRWFLPYHHWYMTTFERLSAQMCRLQERGLLN